MPAARGNMFDPVLVSDLINKVRGASALAKLSEQKPIPFNGTKEFTFQMDKEIDIVAEGGKKTEGGVTLTPVTILPIKFEYGARVSDEFNYATEDDQIDILSAFNDGFSRKVARGIDLAAMHGVNPRSGTASEVVGTNHFDGKVTNKVVFAEATPDDNLEAAVAAIEGADGDITGIAMSKLFSSAMAKVKANGVAQYPEFKFGANPGSLAGIAVEVNRTVSDMNTVDRAIIGDFVNGFKWGYAKEIPMEIIKYGDPDNSGNDLKGHNQVYIRAEVYLGWGILTPESFIRITTE